MPWTRSPRGQGPARCLAQRGWLLGGWKSRRTGSFPWPHWCGEHVEALGPLGLGRAEPHDIHAEPWTPRQDTCDPVAASDGLTQMWQRPSPPSHRGQRPPDRWAPRCHCCPPSLYRVPATGTCKHLPARGAHFADGKTEAQREDVAHGHSEGKRPSQRLNSGPGDSGVSPSVPRLLAEQPHRVLPSAWGVAGVCETKLLKLCVTSRSWSGPSRVPQDPPRQLRAIPPTDGHLRPAGEAGWPSPRVSGTPALSAPTLPKPRSRAGRQGLVRRAGAQESCRGSPGGRAATGLGDEMRHSAGRMSLPRSPHT